MTTFKEYIAEGVKRDVAMRFGQILFGNFRYKGEPDTEYEERVFNKLVGFIDGMETGGETKVSEQVFKELIALKKRISYDFETATKEDLFQSIVIF